MLQALFCLILGNQVSARPQVNLGWAYTGDSVTFDSLVEAHKAKVEAALAKDAAEAVVKARRKR